MKYLFLLAILFLPACQDRMPSPKTELDLSVPAVKRAPSITLEEVRLETQEDFDRLEDSYLSRRAPEGLVAALNQLAEEALKADPMAPLQDKYALLLQRLSILELSLATSAVERQQLSSAHVQNALKWAEALSERGEGSAHTLFLQGYIPFTQLGGSGRRSAFNDPHDMDRQALSTAVIRYWGELLKLNKDYQGPRHYSPKWIASALSQMIEATKVTTPEGSLPDLEGTEDGQLFAGGNAFMPRIETLDIKAHMVSHDDILAYQDLARLEQASKGTIRSVCRDRLRNRSEDESVPEARISLFCSIHEGQIALAIELIKRLDKDDEGAFEACSSYARLRAMSPKDMFEGAVKDDALYAKCQKP